MSTGSPRSTSPARQRYGEAEPKGGTIGGKIVAVVALVLVAAVLFFGGRTLADRMNRPISADFVSQERIDDSTGRLWIEVKRKDPSVPSYCIVTAVDYQHAEVGRREVVFPAGGEELTRVAVDIPVRSPLASGHVYGCSTNLPFYLNPESEFYQARE